MNVYVCINIEILSKTIDVSHLWYCIIVSCVLAWIIDFMVYRYLSILVLSSDAPSVELSPCTPGTNYSIVENMGDARFICKVASNPVSGQVEWKLPSGVSEKPNHNNTQLSLLGPDRQYSGLYHCSATNDIGQGSADCILDIICEWATFGKFRLG